MSELYMRGLPRDLRFISDSPPWTSLRCTANREPRILFLDEATSHLDVVRERCVNEAVRKLDLTRVIVAHRSETIASADRVIKLAGGRIVSGLTRTESGPGRHASAAVHALAQTVAP